MIKIKFTFNFYISLCYVTSNIFKITIIGKILCKKIKINNMAQIWANIWKSGLVHSASRPPNNTSLVVKNIFPNLFHIGACTKIGVSLYYPSFFKLIFWSIFSNELVGFYFNFLRNIPAKFYLILWQLNHILKHVICIIKSQICHNMQFCQSSCTFCISQDFNFHLNICWDTQFDSSSILLWHTNATHN